VPGAVERATGSAMASGIEDDLVAGVARLVGEFMAFRGFPEGKGIRFGKAWLWSWRCHTYGVSSQSTRECHGSA
jgi:hypothetical protein